MMMKTDPFTYHLQVKGMVGKRVVGKRGTSQQCCVHDDDKDLEEGDEDVGVGEAAESEREEGRETPVEHCWTWFEFDFQLV